MGVDSDLYFRTAKKIDDEVLARWAWTLGERFGSDRFWTYNLSEERKRTNPGAFGAIERLAEYDDDGNDTGRNDTIHEVKVATRFYGEGYERGDAPFIVGVADLVDFITKQDKVKILEWRYGGDSSWDECAQFDRDARDAMLDLWRSSGRMPYVVGFSEGKTSTCLRCTGGAVVWNGWGAGGADRYGNCPGCGAPHVHRNGQSIELASEQNHSALDERSWDVFDGAMHSIETLIKNDATGIRGVGAEPNHVVVRLRKMGEELRGLPGVPDAVVDALLSAGVK